MYDDNCRVGKPNESFTQFRFPSTFCVHEEAHKFEFSNRERQENAPTKRSYFTSPLNVRLNQMSSVVFFGRKIQWMRKGKSTPRRKKKENFFYVHSIRSPPPSPQTSSHLAVVQEKLQQREHLGLKSSSVYADE